MTKETNVQCPKCGEPAEWYIGDKYHCGNSECDVFVFHVSEGDDK